ncbi:MAG: discoidin domain-containing protein [Pedobacter sp.]|nr:MAG: discoidin domain-containing protein [Pedobacter sp.]
MALYASPFSANNLAKGAKIKASNIRGKNFSVNNILDNNKETYWATTDNIHTAGLEIDLGTAKTFDIISLQEYIPLGQRIEEFNVEVFENNAWKKVYSGESIGAKSLIMLDKPLTAQKLRLNITKSPVCITLSEFGVYKKSL